MKRLREPPTVAILTIIGPELQAMKKALAIKESDRVPGGGYLRYEKLIRTMYSGRVRVQLHVQGKPGNTVSAGDTARIIGDGVRFMLLCGIAAGIRGKVRIGDVAVPRAVIDTTVKVAEAGELKLRPEITAPLKGVLQMNAAAQVDETAWHKLFKKIFTKAIPPPPGKEEEYTNNVARVPKQHDFAILSDNSLLRDPMVLIDAANDLHQQIRVGEMEAGGFVSSCMSEYPPVPWYVVRGISDFGDELKNDDFHLLAASSVASYAALYLRHVLDLRIWEQTGADSPDASVIAANLLKAHKGELAAQNSQIKELQMRNLFNEDHIRSLTNLLTDAVEAISSQTNILNATTRFAQAKAELKRGRIEVAETIYQEVVDKRSAEGQAAYQEAAGAARYLGALAILHDSDKALRSYRQATALDPHHPEGWNQLGRLLFQIGRYDEAEDAYNRLLAVAEIAGASWKALAIEGLGDIALSSLLDLGISMTRYKQALEIYEELGDNEGIAKICSRFALIYQRMYKVHLAEEMYDRALQIYKAVGDRNGMAMTYGSLGYLCMTLDPFAPGVIAPPNRFDVAKELFLKSLEIYKELGDKEGMSRNYINLGCAYEEEDYHIEAKKMFEQALQISMELQDKEFLLKSYRNLGYVYGALDDFDQAELMYNKALTESASSQGVWVQELTSEVQSLLNNLHKQRPRQNKLAQDEHKNEE